MNVIADGVYDALYANADVVGQVGGTPDPRIYRDLAPQGAELPYYVFQRSGGPGDINDTPKEAHEALYLVQSVSEVSPAAAGHTSRQGLTLPPRGKDSGLQAALCAKMACPRTRCQVN